jgi:hypothetical protein
MSFLDSLIDIGRSAVNFFTGNSIGANLARTALTGYALNRVTRSINKENEAASEQTKQIDPGVRLQVNPDTEYRVPVVYGEAIIGGAVTDAVLTNSNQTMFYCLTICEKTGNVNLGAGAASTFTFREIYWDDNRLAFASNGIDVIGYYDKTGTFCDTIGGQVKVYCYAGSSTTPVVPLGYTNGSLSNAYSIMPNWTSNHTMNDLIFAIVRVDYNAEKNVKGLGNMRFRIQNSMTQPGDCLYDYMTNTRYGAGINPAEIYTS